MMTYCKSSGKSRGHFLKISSVLEKILWYSLTTSDAKEAFGWKRRKTL
jgi:hypothetical protein